MAKLTRQVKAGCVAIGGGAPVSVQSMTNTDTADVEATLSQIRALAIAGADIVRVSVYNEDCARALLSLVKSGTRAVFLSHLSLDNNLPELAYNTVCGALREAGYDVGTDVRVTVSRRDKVSDMLVLTSEDVQAGEA